MILNHFKEGIINRDRTYILVMEVGFSIWDRDVYWKSYVYESKVSPFIKEGGKKTFSEETLRRIKENLDVE